MDRTAGSRQAEPAEGVCIESGGGSDGRPGGRSGGRSGGRPGGSGFGLEVD